MAFSSPSKVRVVSRLLVDLHFALISRGPVRWLPSFGRNNNPHFRRSFCRIYLSRVCPTILFASTVSCCPVRTVLRRCVGFGAILIMSLCMPPRQPEVLDAAFVERCCLLITFLLASQAKRRRKYLQPALHKSHRSIRRLQFPEAQLLLRNEPARLQLRSIHERLWYRLLNPSARSPSTLPATRSRVTSRSP